MKQGLSLLLLAFLTTGATASTLGDTMLKGIISGHKPAVSSQSQQPVESYYGGKDLSNVIIA